MRISLKCSLNNRRQNGATNFFAWLNFTFTFYVFLYFIFNYCRATYCCTLCSRTYDIYPFDFFYKNKKGYTRSQWVASFQCLETSSTSWNWIMEFKSDFTFYLLAKEKTIVLQNIFKLCNIAGEFIFFKSWIIKIFHCVSEEVNFKPKFYTTIICEVAL